MQVKIEISSFTAVADLSGAEVEVLNRAFGKMKVGRDQYVESKYVFVHGTTDSTPTIRMEVSPTITVLDEVTYTTMKNAQEAREAKLKAEQEASRAILVEAITGETDEATRRNQFEHLLQLCKDQSLMYYKEADSARIVSYNANEGVVFDTDTGSRQYRITIGPKGVYNRETL